MVNNSAQLDRKTKQHTQFGVSVSNFQKYGSDKIGQKKMNQSHIASPTGIANYGRSEVIVDSFHIIYNRDRRS